MFLRMGRAVLLAEEQYYGVIAWIELQTKRRRAVGL